MLKQPDYVLRADTEQAHPLEVQFLKQRIGRLSEAEQQLLREAWPADVTLDATATVGMVTACGDLIRVVRGLAAGEEGMFLATPEFDATDLTLLPLPVTKALKDLEPNNLAAFASELFRLNSFHKWAADESTAETTRIPKTLAPLASEFLQRIKFNTTDVEPSREEVTILEDVASSPGPGMVTPTAAKPVIELKEFTAEAVRAVAPIISECEILVTLPNGSQYYGTIQLVQEDAS